MDTTTKLKKLTTEFAEVNIDVKKLWVATVVAGEQIIGEYEPTTMDPRPLPGTWCAMNNVKRILRIQQVIGNGALAINIMVSDFDLLDNGKVLLVPQMCYQLAEQTEESQVAVLEMYQEFLIKKGVMKAPLIQVEAPSPIVSPFAKR